MSKALINQYYNEFHRAKQFSGSSNEETLKTPFANLLNGIARTKNLELVREVYIKSSIGTPIRPDGVLRNILQLDFGYWESKDTKDDIRKEIEEKFRKGYPKNNILFEDTQTAILFQDNKEIQVAMQDEDALLDLLQTFVAYERPEVKEFNTAIAKFSEDLPSVLVALRKMIEVEVGTNATFGKESNRFLQLCQESINPNLTQRDVWEMFIQHILTEEIFMSIFSNADYHRENNIAQSLYKVESTFFRGATKQNLLASIRPYYNTIKARANELISHAEKQKFLKIIYENFYKAYNPQGADRLGIVYTPNEIVKFMIEATDYLLEKHFDKTLGSKGVEILDPCTGTGTFVTELIEHIPPHQLTYKYENEIHANEMALLPYYVANLNIEAVFQQRMNTYKEFKNLCFVDTLDNTASLAYKGKQNALFGAISLENVERIKKQNEKKISVIIGNPPYNAKQQSYNEQNANRIYSDIDKRIKETYIREGSSQNQNQVYDMYFKFLRWASDIIDKGMVCFITNRSFIDAPAFNGIRKCWEKEFSEIYVLDLGGDIVNQRDKTLPTGNVFNIKTGVAILFLIKTGEQQSKAKIRYAALSDGLNKKVKLEWLLFTKFKEIGFERIMPDKKQNWINQVENDFDSLLPLMDKVTKSCKNDEAIFKLFSNGLKTGRDEWVYDFSINTLEKKIKFFIKSYQATLKSPNNPNKFEIKWDADLDHYLKREIDKNFEGDRLIKCLYRPFIAKYLYFDKHLNQRTYQWNKIRSAENIYIGFISGISKHFAVLSSAIIMDLNALSPAAGGAQCLPLYRYENGERKDNITDWALEKFRNNYELGIRNEEWKDETIPNSKFQIQKADIFYYVYAVLHNPSYRQKYEQNLKRDFPHIPLYKDFWKWAAWGKKLMDLHLNYETIESDELEVVSNELKNANAVPKPKLKTNKELGEIYIDEVTTLRGMPAEAWEYKLGNRPALEWILDQYKESKPSDPIIAEKFNTYQFADYKTQVIDLLQKVCTVSIETMKIIGEMRKESQ